MERGDSVKDNKDIRIVKKAKDDTYLITDGNGKVIETMFPTLEYALARAHVLIDDIDKRDSFDPVKKPKHYNSGKYEVIDMIESALSALPVLPFQAYCLGNALKYICRAGLKGDFSEDIRKAITYLNWAIGVDLRNEETRNADSR